MTFLIGAGILLCGALVLVLVFWVLEGIGDHFDVGAIEILALLFIVGMAGWMFIAASLAIGRAVRGNG